MHIRSTRRESLLQQVSDNPTTDVVVGSDRQLPPELGSDFALKVDRGHNLYKLSSQALSNREKLIGKSIKLADLSLSGVEQGVMLAQLNLPDGADTVFATTGFVLSGVDVYHSLTKNDADAFEIAIATTKTLTAAADLAAPFLPILRDYQPHFKFATVLLQVVGTGKEVLELTYKAQDIDFLARRETEMSASGPEPTLG